MSILEEKALDLAAQIEQEQAKTRNMIYEWAEALLLALVIAVVISSCLFRVVTVSGNSMLQTLHSGDRLLMVSGFYHTVEKGDIVVVHRADEEPLIKRVIALEGETVDIDRDGNVYVNDVVLTEPYLSCTTPTFDFVGPYTVPAGQVFVMGDNRVDSWDSRSLGAVNEEEILGKAVFRILPFSKIGTVS